MSSPLLFAVIVVGCLCWFLLSVVIALLLGRMIGRADRRPRPSPRCDLSGVLAEAVIPDRVTLR